MDTSRISKIEKAKRYAEERDRFQFLSFVVHVRGDNDAHRIAYEAGHFHSDDDFFQHHGYSAHTMAVEELLAGMMHDYVPTDQLALESSHISKVEKAKRYAQERDRFQFEAFTMQVRGDNDTHTVHFLEGRFESDNEFFQKHGYSAHTIAVERILQGMLPNLVEEHF